MRLSQQLDDSWIKHPKARYALEVTPVTDAVGAAAWAEVAIYVEGSFFSETGKVGWVVIIVANIAGTWHFAGYLRGSEPHPGSGLCRDCGNASLALGIALGQPE